MIKFIKFLLRGLLKALYGVKVTGMQHYHEAGERVLIVANHTSLLDGVLLYAWLPETPTFAINTDISRKKSFRVFLQFVDLFVMDPTSPLSIKSMIKFIRRDKKAVIFPEGRITVTGTLMKVYEGPGLIADKADATILPIAIDGAQFSPFASVKDRGHSRLFPRITLTVLPPQTISLDPGLSGHERRRAAALWMQKIMLSLQYATYQYNKTIFAAVLEAAGKFGMGTRVLEDSNRVVLSYRQIFTRAFILARLFCRQTAEGERVGLMLPNANATVISFLALQYLQRIPAMLNYSAGTQTVVQACETANIRNLYSSRQFIKKAGLESMAEELGRHVNLIYLEDLRNKLGLFDKCAGIFNGCFPAIACRHKSRMTSVDDPALILFTSGSEGLPKGAILSHANVLSNFAQVRVHIDFRASDLVFTCLPLFHSFGLNAGTLMPLLGGSRVFLYPTPLHYRIIPQLIYECGATIFFGTNTFFKGYAKHAHPFDFNSLRYVVAGAEKLRDDTRQLWMEKFGIRIFEGYGVTEASPVISVNTPVISRTGTVGLPLPGIEHYIAPVEGIEEGGRLVVRGPNIMLGYLEHGTDGKIIPPVTERGPGWHDTGDIAAVDEDGFISILGRAKRFAKIGGEMVSLTVVEELAMHTWPDACHAAVSLPDERKGEKIVLVTDYREANRKQILETAKTLKYGDLYIPKKVVLAEELPILGTGKTDYVILTKLAMAEDKEGSGWIKRLSHFVKSSNHKN